MTPYSKSERELAEKYGQEHKRECCCGGVGCAGKYPAEAFLAGRASLKDELAEKDALIASLTAELSEAHALLERVLEAVQNHAEGGNIECYGHLSDKLQAIRQRKESV